MDGTRPPVRRKPRKDLGHYRDLGRGPATSAYRRVVTAAEAPPDAGVLIRLGNFARSVRNWGKWVRYVAKYAGNPKHPFQTYRGTGVYDFAGKPLKLSIAGDWGTGTDEAKRVTGLMQSHQPDFTIHLGDVYYVGDRLEVGEHCLGIDDPKSPYGAVTWERGTRGSFGLCGNHEMYANGTGYFTEFLKVLGPLDDGTGKPAGQEASFFCLQTEHWKIIGLDTGYYSVGIATILSFLSSIKSIKWFRKTSWFKPSCKLHDNLITWLQTIVPDVDGKKRGLVLLSHHQYYSGFDDWYQTPAKQLAKLHLIDRPVLWFWGHEHRMAVYDRFGVAGGIQAFGRCIGHGGMPVDRGCPPDISDCRCIMYDDRKYPTKEDIDIGYNGFIDLVFEGPDLRASYYDLDNTLLLVETWHVDEGGRLMGPEFTRIHPQLTRPQPEFRPTLSHFVATPHTHQDR